MGFTVAGVEVNRAEVEVIADQLERVTQRQQQFERHLARALAVDPVGLAAMEHLMRVGEATPTELSRALGVSTAAMTLVLDRLAAAGHLTRQPHPTDRRKVVVTPAASSVAAAHDLVDPLIDGVEQLVASLDPAERATVSTFLTALVHVYDDALSPAGP